MIEANDGTRLFVRQWGEGKPVLFVSGWALSSAMWQYQMVDLVRGGARCIAFDRRGHGRSDDPGRGYDYGTLATDLGTVIERLGLRDVTLVAHSMGAGEIVRYLARNRDAPVAKVVLVAPAVPFVAEDIPEAAFEHLRELWRSDFPRWLEDNAEPYLGPNVSRSLRDWTMFDMLQTSLHAAIECNRSMVTADFREELAAVRVPTLIVQGDRDASIPLERSGRVCADELPNSRLIVYEGAPHGLYLSHRQRLNDDLRAFLAGS